MITIKTGLHYPLTLDKIPSGWQTGYVGDFIAEIQPGFASGIHNKDGVGIPHIRPFNIDRQGELDLTEIKYVSPEADVKRLHSDDVLFNNTNSPELVGKTAVISKAGDWGFSNHMTRLVFKEDVSPKFAAYQLNYLWMRGYFLYNCVKHVNQASVSSTTLAKTVPFVAPPRDQQEEIVAEIEKQFSRLDEAVANLKRVKANLKRYKAAVLKAAVEGKLTEEWRKSHPNIEPASELLKRILAERKKKWEEAGLANMKTNGKKPKDDSWKKKYKEPAALSTDDLSALPSKWVWSTVQQLAEIQLGKMLDTQKHRSGKKLPYLRNINVRWGSIDTNDVLEMFFKDHEHERYGLNTGDVLVCEGGEPGRAAVWDGRISGMKYQKALHRVRFFGGYKASLLVFYIEYLAKSGQLEKSFTGSTIKHLTGESFAILPVPLPPSEEQALIILEVESRLSLASQLEAQAETNTKRAHRLQQSILKRVFSGALVQK